VTAPVTTQGAPSGRLVYDARKTPLPGFDYDPLVIAAIGLVTAVAAIRLRLSRRERVIPAAVAIGATLLAFVDRSARRDERQYLVGALRSGHYALVEGPVMAFVPGRPDGHPPERFQVGTHVYEISPYRDTGGYSQIRAAGGVLRPGLRVRIYDVDGRIARLEIL
jgi:hypothetical protein